METSAPVISAQERAKRQKSVDVARGSVGLEGFKITPAQEARAQKFINGEMDLQEFVGEQVGKRTAPKP